MESNSTMSRKLASLKNIAQIEILQFAIPKFISTSWRSGERVSYFLIPFTISYVSISQTLNLNANILLFFAGLCQKRDIYKKQDILQAEQMGEEGGGTTTVTIEADYVYRG